MEVGAWMIQMISDLLRCSLCNTLGDSEDRSKLYEGHVEFELFHEDLQYDEFVIAKLWDNPMNVFSIAYCWGKFFGCGFRAALPIALSSDLTLRTRICLHLTSQLSFFVLVIIVHTLDSQRNVALLEKMARSVGTKNDNSVLQTQ